MKARCNAVAAVAAAVWICASPSAASANDLREFSVGMPLGELPASGYTDFVCIGGAGRGEPIAGWADYARCPADDRGRREIGFRYDDGGQHETKVAGQPMLLSAIMAPDGALDALRMRTNPEARLFQRKGGFVFGTRVKERYGEAGWECNDGKPGPDEEPVGGMFLREHCEKTSGVRHLVVDRELFRLKDQPAGQFTSRTTFTVWLASAL